MFSNVLGAGFKLKFFVTMLLLGIGMLLATPVKTVAQCAQCKANVESASQDPNNGVAKGLNTGILYLLAVPYVLALSVGIIWYRNHKKSNLKNNLATRK